MRKILLALIIGILLAVSNGAVAGAAKRGDSSIQGTYTYRDATYSITVGYVCPGYTFFWGVDPYANYAATVSKGGSARTTIMRHAPWKLDVSLNETLGVHLSPKAYEVLANDAATIVCS